MKIKDEHRKKINTALDLCESSFNAFVAYVKTKDKELAPKLSEFLLKNTFFAGGLFRSTFTDEKVNDVDIYFKSEGAVLEFQHLIFSSKFQIFSKDRITNNQTFIWINTENKNMPVTFITNQVGEPEDIISDFDFSFNQHYFSLFSYNMSFDVDTFSKKGVLLTENGKLKQECKRVMLRAFRFVEEGYYIPVSSLSWLIHMVVNYKRKNPLGHEGLSLASSGAPISSKEKTISGLSYTSGAYFSNSTTKASTAYRLGIDTISSYTNVDTPIESSVAYGISPTQYATEYRETVARNVQEQEAGTRRDPSIFDISE